MIPYYIIDLLINIFIIKLNIEPATASINDITINTFQVLKFLNNFNRDPKKFLGFS